MQPISVTIVTLNEERKIGDCLKSVRFADEVVVVDSFSTDRTPEICRSFGVRFIQNPWPGYVGQKNFALDRSSHEWVLSLDADERCSRELREEIREVLRRNPADPAGYAIPRRVYYINRWIGHGGWYPDRKVRLFRKSAARWEGEDPHDRVGLRGRHGVLKGGIHHFSFDDISAHFRTLDNFSSVAAGERIAKGKGACWVDIFFRPPATFLKMYFLKTGFLDGIPGLIIAVLSWFHVFCKYVKVRERTQAGGC